jgi:hypothetical protein
VAITVTSRGGTVKTEADGNAVTTLDSASFTPASGSFLVVFGMAEINDSNYPSDLAVTDRDSSWSITGPDGTGSWQAVTQTNWAEMTWTARCRAWVGKVGASASGVVRITRSPTTSWANSMYLWVAEVAGIASTNITNYGSNGNVTGTTLTLTLGSSPAASSLVMGAMIDTGLDGTITQPSGWTEMGETAAGGGNEFYVHIEAAYLNGSSVQGPQWSSLAGDGTAGGIVMELTLDSGPAAAPLFAVPSMRVIRR